MTCEDVFNSGEFSVSDMRLDYDRVASSLNKARAIKLRRLIEKNADWNSKYVKNLSVPEYGSHDDTDVIGLVGEMVCEMYHIECKRQDPFYTKWKEDGTSKSRGVDLLVEDAGRLLSVECKHTHSHKSASSKSGLLQAVKKGMREHSDNRTKEFLIERHHIMSARVRQLDAEGSDTAPTYRKMDLIEKALGGGFDSQVDLVADRKHVGTMDFERMRSSVAASQSPESGARALLLLADRLHEFTEAT